MNHWLRHRGAWGSFTAGLVLLMGVTAADVRADEYGLFSNAKNAFDAGEYEVAVQRFEELVASNIQNPALVLESYKLLAISYLFAGNRASAEKTFTELLTRSPDFKLDPLLYPMEVIDVFAKVKQRNEKRLEELARARAEEEKRRVAEEKRRRKEEMERLTRNVYIERTRQERSLFVALMPLGAGQFQNGHKTKGVIFLSSEVVLGTAAVVSYFLHSGLRPDAEDPPEDPEIRRNYQIREQAYRLTNHISLGLLAGMIIWGIADSMYHFRKTDVSWRKVDEREVPKNLRPHTKLRRSLKVTIFAEKQGVVAGIAGRF